MATKIKLPEPIVEDWRTIYNCTSMDEALAVLKLGNRWVVSVSKDAYIKGNESQYYPNHFRHFITVSRADAYAAVMGMLGEGDRMKEKNLVFQMYVCEREERGRTKWKNGELVELPARKIKTVWI